MGCSPIPLHARSSIYPNSRCDGGCHNHRDVNKCNHRSGLAARNDDLDAGGMSFATGLLIPSMLPRPQI